MSVRFNALSILCILLLPAQVVFSQAPPTQWSRAYGGGLSDEATSIQETSDGGFIVAGSTFSFAENFSDAWLIRIDATGDTLWTKSYDIGGHESAQSVRQTADGGYILAGNLSGASTDMLLIRTDANGDTLWTRTFGWFDTERGSDVVETPDGGFLAVGTTRSFHNGFGSSLWLVRTSAAGDSLWATAYGGSSYQDGNAINRTSDGGFVVTGSYNDGGSRSADVWLLRLDAAGDTLWTQTYGADGTQEGASALQTSDGGYAVLASGYPTSALIRTDEVGDSLWATTWEGGPGLAGSLLETSDGGFIITGSDWNGDAVALHTDETGAFRWGTTLGGSSSDHINAVLEMSNGDFVVAGSTESYGAGGLDAWVLRLGGGGGTSVAESPEPVGYALHQNYPNPFTQSTVISYETKGTERVTITVFDVLGRRVRTLVDAVQPAGAHQVTWDGDDDDRQSMAPGSYLYEMRLGASTSTRVAMYVR